MGNDVNMIKGFVLSESLNDPLILNTIEKIYVKIESHNDPAYPAFWHLFKLSVAEKDVHGVVEAISEQMKTGWYAHFWNEKYLFICLSGQSFCIDRMASNYHNKLAEAKKYAESIGIESQYLDFYIED